MLNQFEILMIVEGEIATTQIIERLLISLAPYGFTYKKRLSIELQKNDFHPFAIPLFVRCSHPGLMPWVNMLKIAKRPYLYYLDDNFWQLQGDSEVTKYYQDHLIKKSFEYYISQAKLVLTNSIELTKDILKFNNDIQILPPFFDFSLLHKKSRKTKDEIRIGFAGSTSRCVDLDIIAPIIHPIIEKFPQVVFEFIGAMPRSIIKHEKIKFYPHIDSYAKYLLFQKTRHWDIGLAPLVDNAANRCKTNNKYREYGACGIPGIYSDVLPYQRSVKDKVTGMLVKNSPELWMKEIERLIENIELRKEISKKAYADVLARYSIHVVLESWLNAFELITIKSKQHKKIHKFNQWLSRYRFRFDVIYIKHILAYKSGGIMEALKLYVKYVKKFIPI